MRETKYRAWLKNQKEIVDVGHSDGILYLGELEKGTE